MEGGFCFDSSSQETVLPHMWFRAISPTKAILPHDSAYVVLIHAVIYLFVCCSEPFAIWPEAVSDLMIQLVAAFPCTFPLQNGTC